MMSFSSLIAWRTASCLFFIDRFRETLRSCFSLYDIISFDIRCRRCGSVSTARTIISYDIRSCHPPISDIVCSIPRKECASLSSLKIHLSWFVQYRTKNPHWIFPCPPLPSTRTYFIHQNSRACLEYSELICLLRIMISSSFYCWIHHHQAVMKPIWWGDLEFVASWSKYNTRVGY